MYLRTCNTRIALVGALTVAATFAVGCGGGSSGSGGNGGGGTGTKTTVLQTTPGGPFTGTIAPGRLYVASTAVNSILQFDVNNFSNGNLTPAATIVGQATQLNGPQFISLDTANDRMYVGNSGANSILVFDNVSTLGGNVSPARVISGSATTLNRVQGLALDTAGNQLYVANSGTNTIAVFANVSTLSGNIAPSRILAGSLTALSGPSGLLLDSTGSNLYVANKTGNSIALFQNVGSLNGNIAPAAVLSGSATRLNAPVSVQLDNAGGLIVCNQGANNMLTFSAAAGAPISPNLAPTGVVGGFGGGLAIVHPGQVFYVGKSDTLYIADTTQNGILIYNAIETLSGQIFPNREIAGPASGFASPTGVAYQVTTN